MYRLTEANFRFVFASFHGIFFSIKNFRKHHTIRIISDIFNVQRIPMRIENVWENEDSHFYARYNISAFLYFSQMR